METNQYILLENRAYHIRIPLDEILYVTTVTTQAHKLMFVTKTDSIYAYDSLNSIKEKHKEFIYCHRAYLVNTLNIKAIDREQRRIYFFTNKYNVYCPISRREYKQVFSHFQ